MTQLILIRHGQSVWNAKNIFTGWVDVDLTLAGKQEAKLSGELINKINFKPQICFTSYLKRASDTLDIILKEINFSERRILFPRRYPREITSCQEIFQTEKLFLC